MVLPTRFSLVFILILLMILQLLSIDLFNLRAGTILLLQVDMFISLFQVLFILILLSIQNHMFLSSPLYNPNTSDIFVFLLEIVELDDLSQIVIKLYRFDYKFHNRYEQP